MTGSPAWALATAPAFPSTIPAETVLSERALTETLGVSRTPLRAAISRLESEGMVDRLSNGVVLVRSVTVEGRPMTVIAADRPVKAAIRRSSST